MAKVTGKYQITLPKTVVDRCAIRIGENLQFYSVGESIQIKRQQSKDDQISRKERLAHFDKSTQRHNKRHSKHHSAPGRKAAATPSATTSRGWKREDLYTRGSAS
jgi:bifunctional DNA-binding transcriptional regulator/antitoxin component of YhaV-PrlF toxin-antitoxin module